MRTPTRRGLIVAGAGALAAPALFATSSRAQGAFPNKPIRILVPYPAGGQTDGIARVYGEYLGRKLGTSVVVENKGGAGGTIGVAEVKRAPPDGYTILCTISSSLIQNRVTVKDLPYDPEKDFTYLTMTTSLGGPVVAAEKTGATNLKQFLDYAKKVDKLNFGAYGPGSTPQMLIETMARQYGFKVEVVQYRGEAAMFADVAAQQLDGAAVLARFSVHLGRRLVVGLLLAPLGLPAQQLLQLCLATSTAAGLDCARRRTTTTATANTTTTLSILWKRQRGPPSV